MSKMIWMFIYAILPFVIAILYTIGILYLKDIYNLDFEFVLIFIIIFMWAELNIRISRLKHDE